MPDHHVSRNFSCNRTGPCAPPSVAVNEFGSCVMQAVTFLKRIKDVIEDPRRLLLDV